jgi:alpha-1,2-mannosyltransferase
VTSRLDRAAPIVAIVGAVLFAVVVGAVVWSAVMANTFGFDFLAYHQAAARILHGQPLYDLSIQEAGGFGLFYYPPPFAVAVLPLALIPGDIAVWLWLTASIAMIGLAIALLPVSAGVRWLTFLLAALDWPVAYALKLGQVGPLILLLFVIGWRWRDRPVVLGATGALGAVIKVQPGLILAWALLTRRWRAVVVGAVVGLVGCAIATLATRDLGIWTDFVSLLRQVTNPITTPHNFTPGAIAYQMGVSEATAEVLQLASMGLVGIAVVVSAVRHPAATSYLVAVVASQLLSPVLWDHYAMLLLLPVAWLLERGRWWAVLIPLATSVLVLPFGLAPILYPIAFWVTLVGLLVLGVRDERAEPAAAAFVGPAVAPTR